MSYLITITKIETTTRTENGPWTIIDHRPWTDEELSKATSYYGSEEEFLKTNPLKEINGYAPDREVASTKDTQIFTQKVEDLDLAAVIKAINGI